MDGVAAEAHGAGLAGDGEDGRTRDVLIAGDLRGQLLRQRLRHEDDRAGLSQLAQGLAALLRRFRRAHLEPQGQKAQNALAVAQHRNFIHFLLIPFSFDGVDEGIDLVVCARAVCTNTSGRSITIFSSYYVIRSSAVTMALRKGALGLNVANDFNPTDTESTLYINAKPKGASPTIVVNEDAEQPNNGRTMQFIKGTIDYGGLDIKNDSIIGRGMSKIIRGTLLLGDTIQDTTIYINNDDSSFKNDCPITFSLDYPNMSEAQARASRHLRVTNIAHDIANNRITVTYRCNKILQNTASIPFMVQMMSLTAK